MSRSNGNRAKALALLVGSTLLQVWAALLASCHVLLGSILFFSVL